ncbi:MAG: sulfopyruvate decarboxylase subunit alpha [Chloroflexi bacterium]|nr:sulfopyruvate decarboxylase subunit alpha [Chloroflexota bacterium]
MQAGIIEAVVAGLKQAKIDFVATLSCTLVGPILPHIMRDPQFKHVPVGNEGDGIVICAGASMGGKRPAILMENTGVVIGAYALTGLDCQHGGFPFLMVVDHRGSFGDGSAYFYAGGARMAPVVLEGMRIPYILVGDSDKIAEAIVRGQKEVESYGKPAAVLICAEEGL